MFSIRPSFYARFLYHCRPQQLGYLVVSFEPCSEKQYFDLVLRCKLSTAQCLSATKCSSNGSENRWLSWCGTLNSSLHVDPWTNDGKRLGVDREMLTLIVASRFAFLPCWFVEITTNVDIIDVRSERYFGIEETHRRHIYLRF
uniref:Uncharacterized protein n=1 Tax=Romanomermis culicivorax TaxID=13658 RepID=A0A915JL82_ROMCU